MTTWLGELADLLRQNGVRVSPSEVGDAALALSLCEWDERETVRSALKATLCKRGEDSELFDRLFDLYFSGISTVLRGLDESLLRRIEEEGVLEGDEKEMLLYVLREMGQRSPLASALLEGDAGGMAGLLRGASLQLDFAGMGALQAGFYSRRLLAAAGMGEARKELQEVEERLRERGLDASSLEIVSRQLSKKLREIEEAARRYVEEQARLHEARGKKASGDAAPLDRSFGELSREELEKTQAAVRRLAERLKSRLARRERERRRGSLNVRRTLRRNMALGGVFAELVFRRRRPQRPEVMVLCDISDSVRNVSRLMLLFVHTLQSRYSKVRSFAFVSDIGEITEAFREVGASQAVDPAVAGKSVNLYGNSNYGRALAHFCRNHLGEVSRRTTVLVIGDGRNNYNVANVWALKEIARRARRVVWICPEERSSWSIGDSEMELYEKAVSEVVVVRNLGDLESVADRIAAA